MTRYSPMERFFDRAAPTVQTSVIVSRHPQQCACVCNLFPVNTETNSKLHYSTSNNNAEL